MKAPAEQVKEAIVKHLQSQAMAFSLPVVPDQIRGMLDLSGTPKGVYGITVSAEDGGDWAGNTGRVLISIKPSIIVFSHLEEDLDGTICQQVITDVLSIMQGIKYSLEGWQVAWNGNWTVSETTMTDSFRQTTLSATLPLVRQ